jgi:hypothetical protein
MQRTGTSLDLLIDEYLATARPWAREDPYDWQADQRQIEIARFAKDADLCAGNCVAVARDFETWITARGVAAIAVASDSSETFGYGNAPDPDGNRDFPGHMATQLTDPETGQRFLVDFTAAQYGLDQMPLISRAHPLTGQWTRDELPRPVQTTPTRHQRPDWLPDVLYHWTEGDLRQRMENLDDDGSPERLLDRGFREGVYLTSDRVHPSHNANIFDMRRPVRIAVDTSYLDPDLLGPDAGAWELDEEWQAEHLDAGRDISDIDAATSLREVGNVHYAGPIDPRTLRYSASHDARVSELAVSLDQPPELPPAYWHYPTQITASSLADHVGEYDPHFDEQLPETAPMRLEMVELAKIDHVSEFGQDAGQPVMSGEQWGTKYEHIETDMRKGLDIHPLVMLAQPDGRYRADDGNHRASIARHLGLTHLPAYVYDPFMRPQLGDLSQSAVSSQDSPFSDARIER